MEFSHCFNAPSTGAPRRSRGRCKGFGQFRPKTLHLNKAGNLESQGFQGFRLCSVRIKIRYFNGNRRALRVGASHKNPTRRWRYQNKTIVLFLMDSSITHSELNYQGKESAERLSRSALRFTLPERRSPPGGASRQRGGCRPPAHTPGRGTGHSPGAPPPAGRRRPPP